jgi:hypothetical protein
VRAGWDCERRARALIERRGALLERLPGEIRAARALTADVRELIIDEAITFAALEYEPTVSRVEELERVVWDACAKRVRRAREGRYSLVRAGWARADAAALDHVPAGEDPVARVLRREELQTAVEFAASLTARERDVLASKYPPDEAAPLGYKQIARALGWPIGAVRSAERSIAHKQERFAAILSAGRLCAYRAPAVASLAAGAADDGHAHVAWVHVAHCAPCATAYKRQLRYLQSAAFERKVAVLLPFPAAAQERARGLGPLRDWLTDLLTRPFGHESAATAGQLASGGVGRGAGTVAAAKLAALCVSGVGALGTCVATGVLPSPLERHDTPNTATEQRVVEASRAAAKAPEARLTRAQIAATPEPAPTSRPRRQRAQSAATQGGSGSSSHEQTPAASAPADAASNGASEFNAFYQPSTPAPPAPAPATGGDEFLP